MLIAQSSGSNESKLSALHKLCCCSYTVQQQDTNVKWEGYVLFVSE